MKKLRFPILLNTAALTSALWLFVSCSPKETAPEQPATSNAPVTVPTTNTPRATNQFGSAISPTDAKNHVGEIATVRGEVFGVHVSQKGDVFINIGGKHPNAPFTAVCFQQAIATEDLKELDGKTISVRGKIKEYNGQTEIILETADQIVNSYLESSTFKQGHESAFHN